MNHARYIPRDFSLEPAGFGRAKTLRWRPDISAGELTQFSAAQMQHLYVLRLRDALRANGKSWKWFAEASVQSYDRLMKVLRGESILRLEDLAAGDQFLGPITEFGRERAAQAAKEAEAEAAAATAAEAEAARQRNIGRRLELAPPRHS